ncbi:MAG: hypothetical protein EOO75_09845 [Myxococcales bacterium]|nr:MAG: hypothetical protein EOO75_09845 [Myxococcales bacterium]
MAAGAARTRRPGLAAHQRHEQHRGALGPAPLDRARAEALGQALAAALQRSSPLAVSPELLDLAAVMAPAGSVRGGARDVTLHGAAPALVDESVELLADVVVRASADEIEVELRGAERSPVLLVPLVGGEPRTPCACRTGGHARHLVFTPSDEPGLEGYALIVGDRLAFLRR